MSFTPEQLIALEAALASGVQTVKYQDKVVTYQSMDAMLKLRNLMRCSLNTKTQTRIYAKYSNGL